jgi:hypothetical membrane protein
MSSAIPEHGSDDRATQLRAGQADPPGHVSRDTTIAAPTAAPTGWVGRLASAGIIAPPAFFTIMTVLGLVTPGYDWIARLGSELSLGRLGWVMITNFIALGAVELALAAALGRTIGDRLSGWVATGAVGLIGAAFVVAGVCVTDPARLVNGAAGAHTWHGNVHAFTAVVIFFIATPIASLAMARRMRRHTRFAIYCAVTAVATPALLVATFVSGNLLGMAERIVIAYVLTWLTILAHELRRGAFPRS